MRNSPDEKNHCPLNFSYTGFGGGYSVNSDVGEDIEDRVFLGSAGSEKLKKLCASQETCDHVTCIYQTELLRLLSVKNNMFLSKKA